MGHFLFGEHQGSQSSTAEKTNGSHFNAQFLDHGQFNLSQGVQESRGSLGVHITFQDDQVETFVAGGANLEGHGLGKWIGGRMDRKALHLWCCRGTQNGNRAFADQHPIALNKRLFVVDR